MSASNLTSWADASSDEESDVERIAPPPSNLPGSSSYNGLNYEDDHDGDDEVGNAPHFSVTAKERDYSFLFENPPPYTAYIGKLSYEMKTSDDFGAEVERLLRGRGCVANTDKGENQPVQLRNARLITDRATGTSRGYGYVEFDHPQELIAFISTINPQLCGRNIKVDIATGTPREDSRGGGGNNRRRSENRNNSGRRESNRGSRGGGGGGGELDRRGSERRQQSQKDELPKDVGTQFRGGMYVRSDSGGGRAGGGALRRNDSSASQGSGIGGVAAGGDASARQRPSLKLAPRTKPLENTEGGSTSQSSIFGGAKPRDESKFLEKKQSDLNVEDVAIKEATSSMGSMDVNKNEAGDARKNSNETADTKRNEQSDKQTPRRQDSKAGGRGGGKKESNGRRDITRKSGRGGGGERGSVGGSGRGEKNRGRGEGGRNGKRNSTKSYADNNGVSSLAAAASAGSSSPTPPVMPVKTEPTKVPPKKSNSFAAFMDDSDED